MRGGHCLKHPGVGTFYKMEEEQKQFEEDSQEQPPPPTQPPMDEDVVKFTWDGKRVE